MSVEAGTPKRRYEKKARAAKEQATRMRIVDAAIELADADGIGALSMRAIAGRLGAGTMSLYTHVPSKPVLIELMIDAVCGQVYSGLGEPAAYLGVQVGSVARQGDRQIGWQWSRDGHRAASERNERRGIRRHRARHPALTPVPGSVTPGRRRRARSAARCDRHARRSR